MEAINAKIQTTKRNLKNETVYSIQIWKSVSSGTFIHWHLIKV